MAAMLRTRWALVAACPMTHHRTAARAAQAAAQARGAAAPGAARISAAPPARAAELLPMARPARVASAVLTAPPVGSVGRRAPVDWSARAARWLTVPRVRTAAREATAALAPS